MESFETKHSNHALAGAIAKEIGLELPSLRLDSQAKYGMTAMILSSSNVTVCFSSESPVVLVIWFAYDLFEREWSMPNKVPVVPCGVYPFSDLAYHASFSYISFAQMLS